MARRQYAAVHLGLRLTPGSATATWRKEHHYSALIGGQTAQRLLAEIPLLRPAKLS